MKNSEKMLAKIKSRKVKPIPKWHFLGKNILFWIIFLLSIKLGSLAFAVILFAIGSTEFDILSHVTHSKIEFFLSILPILWILFLIIFLFGAVKVFQRTKTGYRYSAIWVIGGSFLLSIVFGSILFFTGGGERLEQKFADNVSIYESIEEKKKKIWSMSEKGFLSGIIMEKEKNIILEDWGGNEWKIDFEKALIRGKISLEKDVKIKIIGKISKNNIFIAQEIRPWKGKNGLVRRQNSLKNDKIYHLIPITLFLLGLYGIMQFLLKKKIIKLILYRKIWNSMLLIVFLVSGTLGMLLVIKINFGLGNFLSFDMMFWHVEAGIAMFIICIFHLIERRHFFINMFR